MRILIACFIILIPTYVYVDRILYFHGRADFEIYAPLPGSLRPDYWGYDLGNTGFVIIDDFDFVVVGAGNKYKDSEIVVDKIIGYGFDEDEVIAEIADSLGKPHLLSIRSNSESGIEVIVDVSIEKKSTDIWIESVGNEKYVRLLEWIRSIARISLFASFIAAGVMAIRVVYRASTRQANSK